MPKKQKPLIIGIGSSYRSDDGVGLIVARKLRQRVGNSAEVIEQSGDAALLMEAWQGAGSVIVIDAIRSGARPGKIHRLEVHEQQLPKTLFHSSTHALGLVEAIELARVLGELPPQLVVYGIEGENFSAGTNLSPFVEISVQNVVDQILCSIF